jgi:hypothetical protein
MDFQRLFKRKQEGPAPPYVLDDAGDALKDREVTIREGELLDGNSPAPVDWSEIGGAITVKAGKILGVLEGRTRIKAGVLEELHPGKFARPLNAEDEFNIPLHVVVMQIQDIFCRTSLEDAKFEGLETPFAELAREDEARFEKNQREQPVVPQTAVPKPLEDHHKSGKRTWSAFPNLPKKGDSVADPPQNGVKADTVSHLTRSEQPKPTFERSGPALEFRDAPLRMSSDASEVRRVQSHSSRREGHERLQELYLTDERLDGAKVADLVLQLPRVTGVVIMLSDGAVLGGELGGGISEKLLSLAPDFVTHISGFAEIIPGGPTSFITFFGQALQISLVIGGDVLMLVGHQGKNLPPGLRERLIATTQALNIVYGPQS